MHDFIHECVGFMCRCGFLFVMEYNDFKKNQPVGVEISSKKEKEKREKKKKKRNIHCLLSLFQPLVTTLLCLLLIFQHSKNQLATTTPL